MKKCTRKWIEDQWLFQCLLSIQDPRIPGRCLYPLINILFISLCALLSGCDEWKSIELFGNKRKRWLSQFIDLSNGIPSAKTFARVFSLIVPEEFERCLMLWMSQLCQLLTYDIVNIDGKTSRGSCCDAQKKRADHIVNAYSPRLKATMGQVKTPNKSNEIKGIPILLKQLNIVSCIVSMDAMGTQKGIANLIREKKAHYVLALKKNHKRFYRRVSHLFHNADRLDYQGMVTQWSETKDYGHGRIEKRSYTMLPMMYLAQYKKKWRDLSAFIRVISVRETTRGIETSTRYYITSLPWHHHKKMAATIREHWRIENTLHWKLDVGLNEDASQIWQGHAARNLSVMRKIVLKLLEDENSSSKGTALKRLEAALDIRYLRKVVGF